jgi:DNA polymerase-1
MQRLLLVDGHSNLYRAFYAIRGLSAPDGTPTNAAYGFLRMLHKLVRELEPTHVGVAFDVGGETFRTRMDERYKAQRPPMPEDLAVQIPIVQEALRLMAVPVLAAEGVEADDVMGTLAKRAAAEGVEVVVATGDKDLMQLVCDPLVKLFHTRHERLLDEAGVEEVFGVPPGRVVEMLALMGDASDNVPGCKGIGAKGARELLARWGSVPALYQHLDEVTPPRAQKALAEHREEVERSRELVTIHTAVPLEVALEELARGGGDDAALGALYRRLGFTSLAAELEGVGGAPSPLAEPAREGTLEDVSRLLDAAPIVAVAAAPGLLAVATPGASMTARASDTEVRRFLVSRLPRLWCYDAKTLLARLGGAEVTGDAVPRDAMLGGYLLAPGEKVELPVLCQRFGVAASALGSPAEEAAAVARLAGPIQEGLEREGLLPLFADVELALVPVLETMERHGVRLDVAALADLSRRLETSLAELEREIHAEAGGEFNVNSPQQLAEVLFTRRGLPVVRRTSKTRAPSTDADVLQELASRGHRLPALILEYREQAKLKSTYVDALPRQVAADGRVHTRFNQAVAATGRLSSSDPNLQNIPIRTELGREVRRAFVADEGHLLLAADYSQIELRVLAHLSGDPGLEEAFRAGADIHRATAARVFDVAPELVSAEQRRAAKTINFGLIYGMGAFALARELGVTRKEAQSFIDAYFARFPRVLGFMEETRAAARRSGKVTTMLGRVRWVAGLDSANPGVRGNAERMAMNAPIQGSAADLMKLSMIRLHHRLRRAGSTARILLQVHDELVLEVREGEGDSVADVVRKEMEGVATLRVPLKVDVALARSWADAKG